MICRLEANLESACARHHLGRLEHVLHGTKTVTQCTVDLRECEAVRAAYQNGRREWVHHSVYKGELILPKNFFVNDTGIAKHLRSEFFDGILCLSTTCQLQPLHVADACSAEEQ